MEAQLSRIAALNKIGVDVVFDAVLSLAMGTGKLGRLPSEATKILFQESPKSGRFVDLTAATKAAAMTSVDRVIGRARNVYDIASGRGVQWFDSTHSASSGMRKGFVSAMDGRSSATAIGKTDARRSSRCRSLRQR